MGKFKVGNRVRLVKPDAHDLAVGRRSGQVGVIEPTGGSYAMHWCRVDFGLGDSEALMLKDQLEVVEEELKLDTSPMTQLTAGYAQFARNLMLEAGHTARDAYEAALYLQERSE